MQDKQPDSPEMYQEWSLGDHLNNIGYVLGFIAERGEVSGLYLSDALSHLELAKVKAEAATHLLRRENQRLRIAADEYEQQAMRALRLRILFGTAAGFFIGFLFGIFI